MKQYKKKGNTRPNPLNIFMLSLRAFILTSFPAQAELRLAHGTAMEAKETKERDSQKVWSDALGHERDKRDRSLGIQAAQFAHDLNIAERKIEKEWKTISQTLQRQVGLAQKRTADIQLEWERGQRTYTDSVLEFERQLARENAANQNHRDEREVFASILFLCFASFIILVPCSLPRLY